MKRKANREDENLNEDDNFEEEKILKKHRMTNHRSRSPDLSQPSYMREFKMNFNKDDRDEETKETKEIKETKEQKEPKRSKDNSGAKTSRLVDFGEQPLTEGISACFYFM